MAWRGDVPPHWRDRASATALKQRGVSQIPKQNTKQKAGRSQSAQKRQVAPKKKRQGPIGALSDMATAAFDDDIRRLVRSQAKALTKSAGNAFGSRSPRPSRSEGNGTKGMLGRDRFTSEKESYSLNVSVSSVGFTVLYDVLVSPMNDTLFPGQVYLAQAHGEYRFSRCSIDFKTSVTPYTTPNGRIWMLWLPDAMSSVPTTLAGIETITNKVCGPAYKDTSLAIPPSAWLKTGASTDGGQAPNLLYHGRLVVVSDCAAATGVVGTLRVKSAVEFQDYRVPQTVTPATEVPFFWQVNQSAKPIFALNTGAVVYPGEEGEGTILTSVKTGWFHSAFAGVNDNRLIASFDTADMPIGTILQFVRSAGRLALDAAYVRLPLLQASGAPADILDGSMILSPGIGKYFFNYFGASDYATSLVAQPENPQGSQTVVNGNQVSTMISYGIVTRNTAVAVSFGLPCVAFGDGTEPYGTFGWSMQIAVVGHDGVHAQQMIAEEAEAKRTPLTTRMETMPLRFRQAVEKVKVVGPAPHASPEVLRGEAAAEDDGSGDAETEDAFEPIKPVSSDEEDYRPASTRKQRSASFA